MAFRHISKVLADARLTAGDLAARGHDGAHNFGPVTSGASATGMQDGMSGKGMGGGTPVREDADVPPDAQADEGGTASELNGKGRGTVKATAVQSHRGKTKREEVDARRSTDTALVLVVRNDGRGLPHAAAMKGLARPGSRPSIRIVGGTHYTASGMG